MECHKGFERCSSDHEGKSIFATCWRWILVQRVVLTCKLADYLDVPGSSKCLVHGL